MDVSIVFREGLYDPSVYTNGQQTLCDVTMTPLVVPGVVGFRSICDTFTDYYYYPLDSILYISTRSNNTKEI